jgi:hypothetical protein
MEAVGSDLAVAGFGHIGGGSSGAADHNTSGAHPPGMRAKDLLNPLRHSDHKVRPSVLAPHDCPIQPPLTAQHSPGFPQVLGLCYIILEVLDFYGFMFRGSAYSADPFWFNAMKVTGILVTAAALRNFGHLAKSNVNKGMFAESRTFSYGECWIDLPCRL